MPHRVVCVVVSYAIPNQRLLQHFEWNQEFHTTHQIETVVVTDPHTDSQDLPPYAYPFVYPESLPTDPFTNRPIFSLSRTKNFGIDMAVRCFDADVVVSTDIDIFFPRESWPLIHPPFGHAYIPFYRMAHDIHTAPHNYLHDNGAAGTISMTAYHWNHIHYDPRYLGYGAEDGRIANDLKAAYIRLDRRHHVYHIAHLPNTSQHSLKTRYDYHNPTLNPMRMNTNCKLAATPNPLAQRRRLSPEEYERRFRAKDDSCNTPNS